MHFFAAARAGCELSCHPGRLCRSYDKNSVDPEAELERIEGRVFLIGAIFVRSCVTIILHSVIYFHSSAALFTLYHARVFAGEVCF